MEYHIRCDDFVFQLSMFALVARILVAAEISKKPPVKTALLYMGNVVRDQIVPQGVAFVHRTPQLAGLRIDGHPYTIPDTVGVHSHRRTVRTELENIRTIL